MKEKKNHKEDESMHHNGEDERWEHRQRQQRVCGRRRSEMRVTSEHGGRQKRVCGMCGRRIWEYEHGGRREEACERRRWKDENDEHTKLLYFQGSKAKTQISLRTYATFTWQKLPYHL